MNQLGRLLLFFKKIRFGTPAEHFRNDLLYTFRSILLGKEKESYKAKFTYIRTIYCSASLRKLYYTVCSLQIRSFAAIFLYFVSLSLSSIKLATYDGRRSWRTTLFLARIYIYCARQIGISNIRWNLFFAVFIYISSRHN